MNDIQDWQWAVFYEYSSTTDLKYAFIACHFTPLSVT